MINKIMKKIDAVIYFCRCGNTWCKHLESQSSFTIETRYCSKDGNKMKPKVSYKHEPVPKSPFGGKYYE